VSRSRPKRRDVYKVVIAYGVVAWLLMQIANQIFPLQWEHFRTLGNSVNDIIDISKTWNRELS